MPTFDGDALTITLDSGVTDVDVVADLFSSWKDWMLSNPVNRKYPQAFRSDGGNPLSSIINQGSYIFLNNTAGWRIKPPEENITIYLTGNLAVEDTTLPAFKPTVGAYTAAILGLQPVTQGVTPVMAEQLEYASFEGGVWINQANGVTGTDGVKGNAQHPVNNFIDGHMIMHARGLPSVYYVIGDYVMGVGDNINNHILYGQNPINTTITIDAAAEASGCDIRDCTITGNLDGGNILRNCVISDLNYINGFVHQCMINPGTVSLGGSNTAFFLHCYSGVPGTGTPIIDMNGTGAEDTPLAIRGYNGGIKLIHKTGIAPCSIDLASGQVIIDSTCTAGTIVVRGDGKVVDSLGNHMLSGTYNGGLTLINECNYGDHVHDIWLGLGLNPDNPGTGSVIDEINNVPTRVWNHTQ